ncbi:hypothetical protein [uncultured Anaerovibrio sp.]|nr:hypothetical protein [uncultured Anaerovibrio sp.]
MSREISWPMQPIFLGFFSSRLYMICIFVPDEYLELSGFCVF